jgi:hypothetical protein
MNNEQLFLSNFHCQLLFYGLFYKRIKGYAFFAGGQRGLAVQVGADPYIKGAFKGLFGLLAVLFAEGQVFIHRMAKIFYKSAYAVAREGYGCFDTDDLAAKQRRIRGKRYFSLVIFVVKRVLGLSGSVLGAAFEPVFSTRLPENAPLNQAGFFVQHKITS